jgi:signal transduction histidine kinase
MATARRRPRRTDRYPRVGRAVAELAAAVRDGRDGTEVLGEVCAQARALTGARTVSAMAVEPDGGLVVRAVAGPVAAWRRGTRVPAVDTFARTAVGGGGPVTTELRQCRYRHERALAAAGMRRVLYVPVPRYGSVTGVLGVGYRTSGVVTARQLRLLEPMALVVGLVPGTEEVDCARSREGAEERAAVGEREWLARELHDSLEQTLYGINLGARTAGELLRHDPGQAQRQIAWIQETTVAGLTDLRGLILRLRPEALAGNGLTASLVRLLETPRTMHGYRAIAELEPEPSTSAEVKQALYRIAQEAVQNAVKHAGAAQVMLRMFKHGPAVVMEVVDDGRGFEPDSGFPGRLGLRSMHERAEGVGGRLEIVSTPGSGTLVRATLPADDRQHEG